MSPSACFRDYFVHKFRAMLGKNRVIFPGEKVPGRGTWAGDPGVAPGLVTVPAVPAGAAGSVRGPGLQRHGPAGAGGESGDSGQLGGHRAHSPLTPHVTPLLCQGLSREAAKRLRFVPGLVYVEGERAPLLLCVHLPIPNPFPVPCPIHGPTVCSLPILAPIPVPCPTPAPLPVPCPAASFQLIHCLFPVPFPAHCPFSTPFPAPLPASCPITDSLHCARAGVLAPWPRNGFGNVTAALAVTLHLPEGAVRRQSPEQREQTLAQMETLLQATGFPYHMVHLEEVLG